MQYAVLRAAGIAAAIGAASEVIACAPAPRPGEHVEVVREAAVIVWDPTTKTEHFIRRAELRGSGSDFGFLVPTPSAPALAEVPDGVFDSLIQVSARKTVYEKKKAIDWTPLLFGFFFLKSAAPPIVTATGPSVNVLATRKIAGYEASVLDATDGQALGDWLAEHGYATAPDLVEWLEPYIRERWTITAFKIDKSRSDPGVSTSAVKMSFPTERPFFPYREPASQRSPNVTRRSLRVFFLGPERVQGTIGTSTSWPAEVQWSNAIEDPLRVAIANSAAVPLPANTRLTRFEDLSTPRPGTDDLFFASGADQSAYIPPPHVVEITEKTHVPADFVAIPLLAIGLIFWRARRNAMSRSPYNRRA
jgi:hypothetical protein